MIQLCIEYSELSNARNMSVCTRCDCMNAICFVQTSRLHCQPVRFGKFVEVLLTTMAAKAEESKDENQDPLNLVWIDCEMTGLDDSKHHICEIAVLVTNKDLEVIAEGPEIVIHLDDDALAAMDPWCQNEFGKSGLTQQVKDSKVDMQSAETQVLEFIQKYVPKKKGLLCGNSIAEDKRFLKVDMPKVMDYLHFRMIDVTTLKELARRWYPKVYTDRPKKGKQHRAMADIKESVKELAYYRKAMFATQ